MQKAVVSLAVASTLSLVGHSPVAAQTTSGGIPEDVVQRPLPGKARPAGGTYVGQMEVHRWAIARNLEELAQASKIIAVAEVVAGQPVLSKDETYISTISTVRIIESIKGDVPAGRMLKVMVPGGRMTFEDGSTAEIRTLGLAPLTRGTSYVLFLDPVADFMPRDLITPPMRQAFVPTLGPQGVFELTADGVHPQGRPVDELKKTHQGEPVATFLAKVRLLK